MEISIHKQGRDKFFSLEKKKNRTDRIVCTVAANPLLSWVSNVGSITGVEPFHHQLHK